MKKAINVLSVNPAVNAEMLAEILSTAKPGVKVTATAPPGEVGECERYWIDGEDLWAEVRFEEWFGGFPRGMHAEGIVMVPLGQKPQLMVVVLTTLPRGMLSAAAMGKPFTDAVLDAEQEFWRRRGRP